LPPSLHFLPLAYPQQLQIHCIDVGQGSSDLIIGPNGTSILIDGGRSDTGYSDVVPYLNDIFPAGSRHLDYIIASVPETVSGSFRGLLEPTSGQRGISRSPDNQSGHQSGDLTHFIP
jgi:hypothetical protein